MSYRRRPNLRQLHVAAVSGGGWGLKVGKQLREAVKWAACFRNDYRFYRSFNPNPSVSRYESGRDPFMSLDLFMGLITISSSTRTSDTKLLGSWH